MSENLDSCFPRVLQKLWISALITLRTLLFGFGVNFSPLDRNLISSAKSSLEDKFTIFQERIMAGRGNLSALAGICEFHLSYF